jgi:hypothetical protein
MLTVISRLRDSDARQTAGFPVDRHEQIGIEVRGLVLQTAAMRSKPAPVSIDGLGSGVIGPTRRGCTA